LEGGARNRGLVILSKVLERNPASIPGTGPGKEEEVFEKTSPEKDRAGEDTLRRVKKKETMSFSRKRGSELQGRLCLGKGKGETVEGKDNVQAVYGVFLAA